MNDIRLLMDMTTDARDLYGLDISKYLDWIVAPVTRTSDSDLIEAANFCAQITVLGGEGQEVQVRRLRHSRRIWIDVVIVDPERREEVQAICDKLDDDPVLDFIQLAATAEDFEQDQIQDGDTP